MVNIFARKTTDSLTSLVKKVDQRIQSNPKLFGFVVVLTDDSDATSQELEKLAKKNGIKKLPLTLFEGTAGPPSYQLAKDAEVTIHMWVGAKIKVNHAFAADELDDAAIDKVVADIAKIVK